MDIHEAIETIKNDMSVEIERYDFYTEEWVPFVWKTVNSTITVADMISSKYRAKEK